MKTIISVLRDNKVLATIFIITALLFIIGELLNVYGINKIYDKIVHLILPGTGAPLLYAYLTRIGMLPRALCLAGGVIMIFTIGVTLEALWEIIEFSSDHFLGTQLQHSNFGTMLDIIMAVIGSTLGALWYAYRSSKLNL